MTSLEVNHSTTAVTASDPSSNDYDDFFAKEPDVIMNYTILAIAGIPFTCLLVAFCILLCFRKVEDYYLGKSIGFFIIAMVLRICMCAIMGYILFNSEQRHENHSLFELKVSVVQFTIPFYCFLMVTTAQLFSAHTFYTSLRGVLFPDLKAEDDNKFQSVRVKSYVNISTRSRFKCLQGVTSVMLITFALLIFLQKAPTDKQAIFKSWEKVTLWFCEISLYTLQVMMLAMGIFLLTRLRNLGRAKPTCPSGLCGDTATKLCRECTALSQVLSERIPIIVKAFTYLMLLLFCQFALYTAQRATNLFGKDDSQSMFNLEPSITALQVSLEFIISVSIFVAICFAQKRRSTDAADEFVRVEESQRSVATVRLDEASLEFDQGMQEGLSGPRLSLLERQKSSNLQAEMPQIGDATESESSYQSDLSGAPQDYESRMNKLLRITTLHGDQELDYRSQVHQDAERDRHLIPRQRMYSSDDEDGTNDFD